MRDPACEHAEAIRQAADFYEGWLKPKLAAKLVEGAGGAAQPPQQAHGDADERGARSAAARVPSSRSPQTPVATSYSLHARGNAWEGALRRCLGPLSADKA